MTQDTRLPSPPPEKMQPPQYDDGDSMKQSRFTEKDTSHGHSSTASLDAHLITPGARDGAHVLATTVNDATDGAHCTQCTANEAARALTRYLFELRQSKKDGAWSKEDKKAAKVELKGLMREVKGVVREEKARLKKEGGQK